MRKAGLRPVLIWVPDTRRKGFAEECQRQSLLVQRDQHERKVCDWLTEVADTNGWE